MPAKFAQALWPVGNMEGVTHYEWGTVKDGTYHPVNDPARNPRVQCWYVKGGVCDFSIAPVLNGVARVEIAEHTFWGGCNTCTLTPTLKVRSTIQRSKSRAACG